MTLFLLKYLIRILFRPLNLDKIKEKTASQKLILLYLSGNIAFISVIHQQLYLEVSILSFLFMFIGGLLILKPKSEQKRGLKTIFFSLEKNNSEFRKLTEKPIFSILIISLTTFLFSAFGHWLIYNKIYNPLQKSIEQFFGEGYKININI